MTLLPIHIVAGGLGLLSGDAALSVTKGAPLHRKTGMLFVCAMFYWLWRIRGKKTWLGTVGVGTPQVSGATK